MPKNFLNKIVFTAQRRFGTSGASLAKAATLAVCAAIFLLAAEGCKTTENTGSQGPPAAGRQPSSTQPPASPVPPATAGGLASASDSGATNGLILQPGDSVKIVFPGSPSLDTTQVIRRDGKVTLAIVGEFQAAGITPVEMEKKLLKAYEGQLRTEEVSVTVQSSAFIVYVTGAVGRAGQLNSDRHLSPLEAVIQAGVDITKANLKAVRVIRTYPGGRVERYKLNLKMTLDGHSSQPFDLEPLDIIYVPERFTWF